MFLFNIIFEILLTFTFLYWLTIYSNHIKKLNINNLSDNQFFIKFNEQEQILELYEKNLSFSSSKFYLLYTEISTLLSIQLLKKEGNKFNIDKSILLINKINEIKANFFESIRINFELLNNKLSTIKYLSIIITIISLSINLLVQNNLLFKNIFKTQDHNYTASQILVSPLSQVFYLLFILSFTSILKNRIIKYEENYKIDFLNYFLILVKKI